MMHYPKFDHNGTRIAAYSLPGINVGDTVPLVYVVDDRGNGVYRVWHKKLTRTEGYNNTTTSPSGEGIVESFVTDDNGAEYFVWVNRLKNPVGRPPKPTERMSFALDPVNVPFLESESLRLGYIHKRSGKPNLSACVDSLITESRKKAATERNPE